MKLLEYGNCFYNLDMIESFKCLGVFENEIEIIFTSGKKLHFKYMDEFPIAMNEFINFIKNPQATYFRLNTLVWKLS